MRGFDQTYAEESQTVSIMDTEQDLRTRADAGSPTATFVEGDELHFEAVHADLNWRLWIKRDSDGQARFELVAMPPEGQALQEPVQIRGGAAITR